MFCIRLFDSRIQNVADFAFNVISSTPVNTGKVYFAIA